MNPSKKKNLKNCNIKIKKEDLNLEKDEIANVLSTLITARSFGYIVISGEDMDRQLNKLSKTAKMIIESKIKDIFLIIDDLYDIAKIDDII